VAGLAGLRGFGVEFRLAFASAPVTELSPGEIDLVSRLGSDERRASWRLGRAALKSVLSDLGEDPDTSRLRFPHPRLSLSHSGGVAAALGLPEGKGAGIDLETREPGEEAARRVLGDAFDGGPDDWQRLWTVLEAGFKADLANAGRTVNEYRPEDPAALEGVLRRGELRIRYGSVRAHGGWLTLARTLVD
jgi:4'-phosphopantetheinyl transferase EntD